MTDEIKFSVTELVEIFDKMPIELRALCVMVLGPPDTTAEEPIKKVTAILKIAERLQDNSFVQALSNWNWDSHPPHTDPAILVLVEELLEEYRDNRNDSSEKTD